MADYAKIMADARKTGGDHAAAGGKIAPVLHADTPSRLTKRRKRAGLRKRRALLGTAGSDSSKESIRMSRKKSKRKGGKRRKLTRAQIRAGFGGKRRKSAARRRKRKAVRKAAPRRKRRRAREAAAPPRRTRKRRVKHSSPRKSMRRKGKRRHKVRGHYAHRKGRRVHVKGHLSHEEANEAPKRKRRKKRKGGKRRKSSGKRRAAPRRRRSSRRGKRKHGRKGEYHPRRRGKARRYPTKPSFKYTKEARRRGRRRRHRGAFENPLDGMEFGIMLFTGLLGFLAADFGDRYLAASKAAALPEAMGREAGPMDWKRWLLGAGLTAVGIVPGHFIRFSPALRSVMQGFGYGAGIRTVGKGASDLIAKLTASTSLGQRLYAAENAGRAYVAQIGAATGGTAGLPAGVGSNPECPTCKKSDGLGSCCRSSYAGAPHRMTSPPLSNVSTIPQQPEGPIMAPPTSMTPPAARVPGGGGGGGGGGGSEQPPPVVAQQPPAVTVPGGASMPLAPPIVGVRGLTQMGGLQNRNWGANEDREA